MLNNRMKGAYYHTYQVKLASKANVMALIDELKSYYEVLMKLLNETNDRIDHDREVMKEKLNAIYNKLLHMQFILTKFNDEIDLAIAEKLQNLMEHFETGIVDMIQQYDCNLFNHNLFTGVEEGEELKLEDSEIYDRSIFHIGTELGFRWFGGKISSKRVLTELDNCFRLTKATNLGMKKTEDYINSNPIIELFIYGPRGMSWLEIGQNATFGYNVVIKYNSLKDNLKATLRSEDYTVPREFDTNVLDINIIFDMLYDANDNLKEDTYIKVKTNLPAASFGGIPQYFLSDAKSTSDYADAKAVKNSDVRVLNENNRDVSYAKDFNDSVEDFYKKQPEVIITSQTFRHKDNKSTDKELLENMTSMDGVIEAKLDAADTVKISSIVKRTDQNDEFGGVDALHSGITLGELGKDSYQDEEYFTDKQDLINESMEPNSSPLYNSGDQNIDLFDYRDLGTVSLITKNENMFGVDNAMHNSPVVVNNNEDYGDFKNDKGLRNKIINDSLLDVLSDNEFYEDKPAKVSEMGHVILENENGETTVGDNIKITGVYETSAGTFASSNAGVYKWDDNYSKFVKTNITKGNWGKIFSTPDGNVWFLSLDNDGIYKLDRTVTDSNANPQLVRTNVVTGTFTDAIVTKTGDFFALCSESNHNFDPITSKYKINALVWVYTDGNLCEYSDYLVKKYNDDSLDCVINEEIATKLTGGSYKVWHLPLIDTFYILNLKSKTLFKSAVGIFGDFSIAIPNEVSNYQDGYVTIDGKIQKMTADGNFSKVYTKTTTEINGLKNVVSNHVVTDMNLEDLNYCDDETDSVEIPDGTIKVLDDEMFAIPENLSYSVKEYEEVIKKAYQLIYDTILNDGTKKETVMVEKETPFHHEAGKDDTYISDFKERKAWFKNELNYFNTKDYGYIATVNSVVYFRNNKLCYKLINYGSMVAEKDSVTQAFDCTSNDLKYIFSKYTINGIEKNRHIIYRDTTPIQQYNYGAYCSWIYDRNAINYEQLVKDLNEKIKEKVDELYADKTVKYHWIYASDIEESGSNSRSGGYRVIEGFNNFKVEKIERVYPHNPDSTIKKFVYIITVSDDVVHVKPVFSKSGLSQEINIENVKFEYMYRSSTEIDTTDLEGFYNDHIVEYDTIAEADLYEKDHTPEQVEEYNNTESKKIYGPNNYNSIYDLDDPSCVLYDETFNYGDSLEEFKEIVENECLIVKPYKIYEFGEEVAFTADSDYAFSEPEFVEIRYKNGRYYEVYKAKWGTETNSYKPITSDIIESEREFRIHEYLIPYINGIDENSDEIFEEFGKQVYNWKELDWNIKSRIVNDHAGYKKVPFDKSVYSLDKAIAVEADQMYQRLQFQHNGNLPVIAWTRTAHYAKSFDADSMYGPYKLEDPNIETIKPRLLVHYISEDSDECIKRHLCESGSYTFSRTISDLFDENGFYGESERYKRMNYLDFFKKNNIGTTSESIENLKNKFKNIIKTYIDNGLETYFDSVNYDIRFRYDIATIKIKGTDNILAQIFDFPLYSLTNKKINLSKDGNPVIIDGKEYELYKLRIKDPDCKVFAVHPAFDENGKITLDYSFDSDPYLAYKFLVEKGTFDKYFDENGINVNSQFIDDFLEIEYLDDHYFHRLDGSDFKTLNEETGKYEYDYDKIYQACYDNIGVYVSSYITDFDEMYAEKNHDFNAYDKYDKPYSEEIIAGANFVTDDNLEQRTIYEPEYFSYVKPATVDPNTGNLREVLGYTGEYTIGADANTDGSVFDVNPDGKSIELQYRLEVENNQKDIVIINDIPTKCCVVGNPVSSDSSDYCLNMTCQEHKVNKTTDTNGYYVANEIDGYYWHDDEPEEHYPEKTFRPRTINTPIYTEKDVEYNRPNGVLDIQFCNGYFYILLNNDHIYKFDANLTLVGIINCNNATAIYVNSNVLFIQDKDGNIFTDRESIKRHPSLYKTNLFYRKKNGEVIELNTKIVAHAQDR